MVSAPARREGPGLGRGEGLEPGVAQPGGGPGGSSAG